jgi:hypothetical protein
MYPILEVNNYNYVCKWIKYLCFNCVCGPLQYGKSFTTDTSQHSTWLKRVVIFLWFDNSFFNIQQGSHAPGKPGKTREFDFQQI